MVPDPAIYGVPATQLTTTSCAAQTLNNQSTITAVAVNGATQYQFEFSDVSTQAVYATKTSSPASLNIGTVTPALQWGTQYKVRVRAYITSFAGNYGNICTIGLVPNPAIYGVPLTQLRTSDCGKLNFLITNSIVANAVAGATQYEFEFTSTTSGLVVATKLQTSAILTLSGVSGISAGNTYQVRVRARITTTIGNYGNSCLIGILSSGRYSNNEVTNEVSDTEHTLEKLSLLAYPNPFAESVQVSIKGGSQNLTRLEILDISGRLIQEIQTQEKTISIGENMDCGVYLIRASHQNEQPALIRIIKE